jgi:serine/threonine-protein kinase RsbW
MIALETRPHSNRLGLPEMLMDAQPEVLVLDSRLSELSRAQSWAEELADRLDLSQRTRYAIRLCLEEALANIVLHGYRRESGHPILVRRWFAADTLFFAIEDQAPPFAQDDNPLLTGASKPASLESLAPGGNGIPLLRHFAGSLAYERLSEGNRLTMGFPVRPSR